MPRLASDGKPFGKLDRLFMWFLPAFLGGVGLHMSDGWLKWLWMLAGLWAGTAVVRGIEAAHDDGGGEPTR